jgi:hypothetical protein
MRMFPRLQVLLRKELAGFSRFVESSPACGGKCAEDKKKAVEIQRYRQGGSFGRNDRLLPAY